MKTQNENQLKVEIHHIFESGANEIRILEMVKTFIALRYIEGIEVSQSTPMSNEVEITEDLRSELIKFFAWQNTMQIEETERVVNNYLKSR